VWIHAKSDALEGDHMSLVEIRLKNRGLIPTDLNAGLKGLGDDIYKKLVLQHPILNMEYSIHCTQLIHNLLQAARAEDKEINKKHLQEEISAALGLSGLLEHLHNYYLNVPREVKRLRQHQKIYNILLSKLAQDQCISSKDIHDLIVSLSLSQYSRETSQYIRETTFDLNWYRLFFGRTKRLLSVIALFNNVSSDYRYFVTNYLDKIADPTISILACCFYMPRFLTNVFLLLKHTIPAAHMSKEERSLGVLIRFQAQMQRRWFELFHDGAWIFTGLLNIFILTGALGPFAIYATVVCHGFETLFMIIRAVIEINQIIQLKKDYQRLLQTEGDESSQKKIQEFQHHFNLRIIFELIRLSWSIIMAASIFFATCLVIPGLAVNPVVPLIGAVWLVAISLTNLVMLRLLDDYRPIDDVAQASCTYKKKFFDGSVGKKVSADNLNNNSYNDTLNLNNNNI
jgi:hypothetical protein